jgi:hypothetical protein
MLPKTPMTAHRGEENETDLAMVRAKRLGLCG